MKERFTVTVICNKLEGIHKIWFSDLNFDFFNQNYDFPTRTLIFSNQNSDFISKTLIFRLEFQFFLNQNYDFQMAIQIFFKNWNSGFF